MNPLLDNTTLFSLMRTLQNARKIVIMGHRGPDGDALGAALGWAEYLQGLGKSAIVVMPNPFPDFLRWLPNSEKVIFYDHKRDVARHLIEGTDLICMLDFNSLHRLQEMGDVVANSKA